MSSSRESLGAALTVKVKVGDVIMFVSATTLHILQDVVTLLQRIFSGEEAGGGRMEGAGAGRGTGGVVSGGVTSVGVGQQYDLWTVRSISQDPWLNVPEGTV
jgi:hypothetical protein